MFSRSFSALCIKGDVLDGGVYGGLSNLYHIRYETSSTPLISIIIPDCHQKKLLDDCINSILEKINYNNYEITVKPSMPEGSYYMGNEQISGPYLSIIVPVYNVEQYLEKCIGSILGSEFHRF